MLNWHLSPVGCLDIRPFLMVENKKSEQRNQGGGEKIQTQPFKKPSGRAFPVSIMMELWPLKCSMSIELISEQWPVGDKASGSEYFGLMASGPGPVQIIAPYDLTTWNHLNHNKGYACLSACLLSFKRTNWHCLTYWLFIRSTVYRAKLLWSRRVGCQPNVALVQKLSSVALIWVLHWYWYTVKQRYIIQNFIKGAFLDPDWSL